VPDLNGFSFDPIDRKQARIQESIRQDILFVYEQNGSLTFRHNARHLLEGGYNVRTVQEFLNHKNVKTTMIYTHVLNRGPAGVRSPVDGL